MVVVAANAFVAANSSDFIRKRAVFLYILFTAPKCTKNHYYRSFLRHCSVAYKRWSTWNCYTVKSFNNNNSKHRAEPPFLPTPLVLGCEPTIWFLLSFSSENKNTHLNYSDLGAHDSLGEQQPTIGVEIAHTERETIFPVDFCQKDGDDVDRAKKNVNGKVNKTTKCTAERLNGKRTFERSFSGQIEFKTVRVGCTTCIHTNK